MNALTKPATTRHVSGKDVHNGDCVKARHLATTKGPALTRWYQGVVAAENDDGTVDVRYDDGDYEAHVDRFFVRPLKA